MKGLVIHPSGDHGSIDPSDPSAVRSVLGTKFRRIPCADQRSEVLVHELWNVLDLDINVHATLETGEVVGGAAVVACLDEATADSFFSDEYLRTVQSRAQDAAVHRMIADRYEAGRTRAKFAPVDDDRWILNGKMFDAIVIGTVETSSGGSEQFDVWLFKGPPSSQPYTIRVAEHSLRDVMEVMILGDEDAAAGSPPHFMIPALKR